MNMIHPVNEGTIAPYIGRSVYAVLRDESYYYGVLSGMKDGKLVLNDSARRPGARAAKGKASAKTKNRKRKSLEPRESGVFSFDQTPYTPQPVIPGGRIAVDAHTVAFLYVMP